jgi:uncharacterized glyoxalase superfamily protein PhnB
MHSPIVPGLRYADADAAVEFLQSVLGFSEHQVFRGEDGKVAHAELRLGDAVIMVAPALDSPWGRLMKLPAAIGGFNTQALYLVVPDADAVCSKVRAAAWNMLIDIKDQPYGGRDFTCRDPGGHIWSVGTYNPWTAKV